MRPARIEIEIDELVLDGFPAVDGTAVAAEIERALTARLLSIPVDGGSAEAGPRSFPRAIGIAVAERLHESVLA